MIQQYSVIHFSFTSFIMLVVYCMVFPHFCQIFLGNDWKKCFLRRGIFHLFISLMSFDCCLAKDVTQLLLLFINSVLIHI